MFVQLLHSAIVEANRGFPWEAPRGTRCNWRFLGSTGIYSQEVCYSEKCGVRLRKQLGTSEAIFMWRTVGPCEIWPESITVVSLTNEYIVMAPKAYILQFLVMNKVGACK